MATRSYTLTSDYVPTRNEELGLASDSGSDSDAAEDVEDQEKIWKTGPLYKTGDADSTTFVSRRIAHPPRFIPAMFSHDALPSATIDPEPAPVEEAAAVDAVPKLGSWYKSIRPSNSASSLPKSSIASSSAASLSVPPLVASSSSSSKHPLPPKQQKRKARPADWFIHNALSSSRPTSSSDVTPNSSSSSLADILSRAPPPLPNAADNAPPARVRIRTKLGPGNKGYALLAQKGWKEGEGLGAWRVRPGAESSSMDVTESAETIVLEDAGPLLETPGAGPSSYTDSERVDAVEVIDLTNDDDSDEEEEDGFLPSSPPDLLQPTIAASNHPSLSLPLPESDPSRTVLLQPILTYLKPDKLGIGASFHPPSRPKPPTNIHSVRQSQTPSTSRPSAPKRKPLTDTAQAMFDRRDQIRRAREAEHRALMVRLKGGKRGAKAFAAVKKEEERKRQDLLAYMHS